MIIESKDIAPERFKGIEQLYEVKLIDSESYFAGKGKIEYPRIEFEELTFDLKQLKTIRIVNKIKADISLFSEQDKKRLEEEIKNHPIINVESEDSKQTTGYGILFEEKLWISRSHPENTATIQDYAPKIITLNQIARVQIYEF